MSRFCVRFGGSIVLCDYLMLEVHHIDRGERRGMLSSGQPCRIIYWLAVRPGKRLREELKRVR